MECKQPKKVLLLIKVSSIQICVLLCKYIKLSAVHFLYECQTDTKSCQVSRTTYLGEINIHWHLSEC